MKNLLRILSIYLLGVSTINAADSLHGASNIVLLQAACPTAWEKVDKVYAKPSSVPWANETDRQKNLEFQRNFILQQTKTGSRDTDSVSRDVITVLSECVKRHNLVVRAEFNKTIGKLPELKERVDITQILMLLLLDDSDEN